MCERLNIPLFGRGPWMAGSPSQVSITQMTPSSRVAECLDRIVAKLLEKDAT